MSDNATIADFSLFSPAITSGDPQTYADTPPSNDNINMPAAIYGFKFDAPECTKQYSFSFDSLKGPTTGSFYAKDGSDKLDDESKIWVTAWNTGLDGTYVQQEGGPYANMFITVPDSSLDIPLPPSAWLLGSGLIGLAGLGWRRRKS